jgi:fido (protein-threonine AMPylation protein)
MFALPSLWNLIISTFVFIIAAKYLHIFLDGKGLAKGMPRGTLVFAVAYLLSWGSGEMVDWTQEKIGIAQPAAQNPDDLQQLLNIITSAVTPETLEQGSK